MLGPELEPQYIKLCSSPLEIRQGYREQMSKGDIWELETRE